MRQALKAGFLSFDSVRVSSNDVDFPIDIITYENNSFNIIEKRYEQHELQQVSAAWNEKLIHYLNEMPGAWMEKVFPGNNQGLNQ